MDSNLEKYYTDRFFMMSQQGWKDLITDAESMLAEYNKITSVDTIHSVDFRKGQVDILSWLIGLRDISEHTYQELQNETIL